MAGGISKGGFNFHLSGGYQQVMGARGTLLRDAPFKVSFSFVRPLEGKGKWCRKRDRAGIGSGFGSGSGTGPGTEAGKEEYKVWVADASFGSLCRESLSSRFRGRKFWMSRRTSRWR